MIEEECYIELEKLAAKRGCTIQDIIRESINKNLSNNYAVDNIDLITNIIREQLTMIINPAVNRLAALSSKTCVQSATAAYLTAETINKFVPEKYQEEYLDVYEAARKKAVSYTKQKSID